MKISIDKLKRLNHVIDLAWDIMFEKIRSGRQLINKESSLQLHFSKIISELGMLYCILPNEFFHIEMESNHEKKSIDIICELSGIKAAIELKCFRKASNRAKDIDMYDVLVDIEKLENYDGFHVKKFICLTDNPYYSSQTPTGLAKSVSLKNGVVFKANMPITPEWAGKWKVKRDRPIRFKKDVVCLWQNDGGWYFLKLDI